MHASARCPRRRAPPPSVRSRVEIVEPLRVLRVLVDAEAHGLRADLTFTARTRPVEEPRFIHRDADRVVFDYTRMTQWGAWEGWVEVDGRRTAVTPDGGPGVPGPLVGRAAGRRAGRRRPGPGAAVLLALGAGRLRRRLRALREQRGGGRHPVAPQRLPRTGRGPGRRRRWRPPPTAWSGGPAPAGRRGPRSTSSRPRASRSRCAWSRCWSSRWPGSATSTPSGGTASGEVRRPRAASAGRCPPPIPSPSTGSTCRRCAAPRSASARAGACWSSSVIGPYEPGGLTGLADGAR